LFQIKNVVKFFKKLLKTQKRVKNKNVKNSNVTTQENTMGTIGSKAKTAYTKTGP